MLARQVLADADPVAQKAATMIAAEARAAVAARGRFIMAVSGGHTRWVMLRALAGEEVPWEGYPKYRRYRSSRDTAELILGFPLFRIGWRRVTR